MSTTKVLQQLLVREVEEHNETKIRVSNLARHVQSQHDELEWAQKRIDDLGEDLKEMRISRDWFQADYERVRAVVYKALTFDVAEIEGMDKIPAIKHVREVFGLGLKEAKDVVDRLESEGRWTRPTAEELEALSDQQDAAFRERVAARLEEAGISSSDITGEEGRTTYVTD